MRGKVRDDDNTERTIDERLIKRNSLTGSNGGREGLTEDDKELGTEEQIEYVPKRE